MTTVSHQIDAQDLAACLAFAIRGYPMRQQATITTAFAVSMQQFTKQTTAERDRFIEAVAQWCALARVDLPDLTQLELPLDGPVH